MPNRPSRRLLRNHNDKDRGQQQVMNKRYDCQTAGSGQSGDSQNSDHVIADIAKSFIQLQDKAKPDSGCNNNQEMIALLEKLNKQMENIQKVIANKENSSQSDTQPQQPEKENLGEVLQMLEQLLRNSARQAGGSDGTGYSSEGTVSKSAPKNSSGGSTAKTAQELLAKAQFELSNELEASLTKLKQVIRESEQVVSKVSSLLGEKNTQS
ncbi:hypothetical protein P22_0124 [Propionispora sp. 2/2-37]|uniref:hypothetical protein n=1 Tax=Propionispora sp. 2/2-37 TaxID=1677858 RepID=UPI0006BB60CE|nr:hypothetical protein [Propionispora sp. 2/2-37]CUH94062.1 hypothetical protein P22_0124 [Propionispora sp. 2/2-37]